MQKANLEKDTDTDANITDLSSNSNINQAQQKQNTNDPSKNEKQLKPEKNQSSEALEANSNFSNEETNVENLLKLIKDQTSELRKNKKRLEKLEEAFKKTSTDLKLATLDKTSLESFIKLIFPKEMHDKVFSSENGSYSSSELSKFWLVCESKNQYEFQKILNKLKSENADFTDKNKNLQIELESKLKELKKVQNDFELVRGEYADNKKKFQDMFSKYNVIESEKLYLMSLVDEKNNEIECLRSLEVENAELKAKTLLENINFGISKKNNGNGAKDHMSGGAVCNNSSNSYINSNNNEADKENRNLDYQAVAKIKKFDELGSIGANNFMNCRRTNMLKICKILFLYCHCFNY